VRLVSSRNETSGESDEREDQKADTEATFVFQQIESVGDNASANENGNLGANYSEIIGDILRLRQNPKI